MSLLNFISVIIPAYNAAHLLPTCLKAVTAQEGVLFGRDYEVILVDDGSTDETARVAKEIGVRVISQFNRGPAAARNRGAREARGEILAFTDADCIPAADWLVNLTQPFKDPQVSGVKGVYRTNERGVVPRFVQAEYEERYRLLAQYPSIDFVDTYAAAYRRAVFLDAGGFDEKFPVPSVEDQELSFRLARQGCFLVFISRAAVTHRHDLTIGEYVARKFGIGYWKALMLRQMPERAFKDTYTPRELRWQILLAAVTLATLPLTVWNPAAGWMIVVGAIGFLVACLPFLLHLARYDPALLWAAPGLLLARALSLGFGLAVGFLGFHRLRR